MHPSVAGTLFLRSYTHPAKPNFWFGFGFFVMIF